MENEMLTPKQQRQLIEIWGEQGMPEPIAKRQIERVQRGQAGMNDELARRLGNLRIILSFEDFYDLFDAAQEAQTFDALPVKFQQRIEEAEGQLQETGDGA
jgi:hypothetical protein